MNLDIDKIFCCHHPSGGLKKRKQRLVDFFAENDLEVEWVEGFPPEEAVKQNHDSLLNNVLAKGPERCRGDLEKAEEFCGKLISLILKHNYCCDNQLENNYENILVLEDDVDLFSNFSEKYFNKCMQEFRDQSLEMLFMGSCCGLSFPYINQGQYVYQHESLLSRCTHCYILNIKGAEKVNKHCHKIIDAADWQYNWIIKKEKIKNAWAEPSVGQLEEYESTLK
jgi:hypothetical protein